MNESNNINVIFTTKAISSLENIVKKFNIEETVENFLERNKQGKSSRVVILGNIAKNFVLEKISEKDLPNVLKKDLDVSIEMAKNISDETIGNLVPFLEKVSEEQLKDPVVVDELSKKFWGKEAETKPEPIIKKPQILTVEENEKIIKKEREKNPIVTKKLDDFPVVGEKKLPEKKLPATEKNTKSTAKIASSSTAAVGAPRNDDNNKAETKSKLPKKPITPPTQKPKSSGPDSYRESIE